MSIKKLHLPLKPFPKPRGQLGKHGNMTHSIGGYRKWQSDFRTLVIEAGFMFPPQFHSVFFMFGISQKRGHPPDLSNLQGGVEDALVKHGHIRDDNWKVLQRFYTEGVYSAEPYIELFICENKKELIYLIDKFGSDG